MHRSLTTSKLVTDNPSSAECVFSRQDDANTMDMVEKGYLEIIQDDFEDLTVSSTTMSWQERGDTVRGDTDRVTDAFDLTVNGVTSGISVIRDAPVKWGRSRSVFPDGCR